MKVCCLFSLEPPHQGNSYEYTKYTIINTVIKIKKENQPKLFQIYNNVCPIRICLGLKNEFEIAVVNESSVFELLIFYCIIIFS